jgi:hypothetical protein
MTEEAQGRFKFDADTAAYNARMEESKRKSREVGEHFVEGFKEAIPTLAEVGTAAGAIGLAVEGVRHAWDRWLERLKLADETSKQLVERLAGVAGGAGVLAQYPQLKRGIEDAAGPLTVEQRVSAFGKFAGANPDMAAEHGVEAVQQAQQASLVVGPEGVDRFVHALGIAMRAGLDQKTAGNVAITAAQAGDSGVEALDKLFASYLERFGATGGPDFLAYAKNASGEDFGKRGIIGGTAFQAGLARGTTLEGQAALAGTVDEELDRGARVRSGVAGAGVTNGQTLGPRAALIEQLNKLDEAGENLGGGYFHKAIENQMIRQGAASPFEPGGLWDKYIGSIEDLSKIVDDRLQALLDAQAKAGAAKFRTEAHEERDP